MQWLLGASGSTRRRMLGRLCGALVVFGLSAGSARAATVLYQDREFTVENARPDQKDLWLTGEELHRVTGFELKPEGACLGEICVPLSAKDDKLLHSEKGAKCVNLCGLARKLRQAIAVDEEGRVFSFGPVPAIRAGGFESAVAPDFELKDLEGNPHKLSDYRGKKVMVMAWASWCACSLDLPNWEKVYEDLKDKNFVLLAAAQDTAGATTARKPYDRAKPTFVALVDPYHTLSTLYNMVNVPTGVWVDEQGHMVRPPEVSYTKETGLGSIKVDGSAYVAALKDWVEKGEQSVYALTPEQIKAKLPQSDANLDLADANFKLGAYFRLKGDEAKAKTYWKKAEELHPDSWNIQRQDWSYDPQTALKNWGEKVKALGDKPYYAPLDLKPLPK